MESFESICNRLIKQPGFWIKVFIGVILASIPFINIFAFGYLRRLINESSDDEIILPMWDFSTQNLRFNCIEGLKILLHIVIFLVIPILVGYIIGMCFSWLIESMSLLLAYFGLLIGMPTAVYSMIFIKNINELTSVKVITSVFLITINTYRSLLVPSFLFLCLSILSVQLLPFAMCGGPLFFGLVFIIAFMKNLKVVYNK